LGHPFLVIKRQFGLMKVRFCLLAKNTAYVITLFAVSNLWMARCKLLRMTAELRWQIAKWAERRNKSELRIATYPDSRLTK
jgi:IS5 family transposase